MKKPLTIPSWDLLQIEVLKSFGVFVGTRDKSVNPQHEGGFMACEKEGDNIVTDGFAVVSNNLNEVISEAMDYVLSSEEYDFMIEGEHPLLDAAIEHGWRIGSDPQKEQPGLHLVHDRLERLWEVNDPAGALADIGVEYTPPAENDSPAP